MTDMLQVYKCEKCGNIIEVVHTGKGALSCCGEPMVLMEEKVADTGTEKHLPVVERTGGMNIVVKVGDVPHPMVDEHFIEWIEVVTKSYAERVFLAPGQEPTAEFALNEEPVSVRSYCNVHGLWEKKL